MEGNKQSLLFDNPGDAEGHEKRLRPRRPAYRDRGAFTALMDDRLRNKKLRLHSECELGEAFRRSGDRFRLFGETEANPL